MYLEYFALFGIERYVMRFSTHHKRGLGKKYVDNEALWLHTESMVRQAMHRGNIPFVEVSDEAAFYGPKIDFVVNDIIGREWQLGTVQVDYQLPQRFELEYIGADNKPHRPVMIHRAPFGSMERFIGVLIEHFNWRFVFYLAVPVSITREAAGRIRVRNSKPVVLSVKDLGMEQALAVLKAVCGHESVSGAVPIERDEFTRRQTRRDGQATAADHVGHQLIARFNNDDARRHEVPLYSLIPCRSPYEHD